MRRATLAVYQDAFGLGVFATMLGRKSENILIVKADGLVSFVQTEPLFEAIRDANPGMRRSAC